MSAPATMEVFHVDLHEGLGSLRDHPPVGPPLYAVLWWRGVPLGQIDLDPARLTAPGLPDAIARAIAPALADAVLRHGNPASPPRLRPRPGRPPRVTAAEVSAALPPLAALERRLAAERRPGRMDASVVVCTRDRPAQLERLLASLGRSSATPLEVIVVDNDPSVPATRRVAAAAGVGAVYVPEPRAGLSIARNAGVRRARGAIIAFTDDDAEVHPDWLWRVCAPFDDPAVGGTTGLVLPADLGDPVQLRFERGLGGFAAGFRRIRFDGRFVAEWRGRGVPVWNLGAGVNMAVRRSAFEGVGLFDERLGAGAAGCSEDSELWYRLLTGGWECRYEPWAVVIHHHRSDDESLRRLARAYARGHTAALLVQYGRHRHRGELVRLLGDLPRHFLVQGLRRALGRRPERDDLVLPSALGYAEAMMRPALARGRQPAPALKPGIPDAERRRDGH